MEVQVLKNRFKIVSKLCLLVIIIFIILFKNNFMIVKINGNSMIPTLYEGEYYVALKCTYDDININDIVVTEGKSGEHNLIVKRVIAKDGDLVEFKSNSIFINSRFYKSIETFEEFTLNVNNNELFLLGDNLIDSYDSRYFGCVSINEKSPLYRVEGCYD